MQSYREKLEEKFLLEYERLNPGQQKAVNTIEGPVMVIAGPGTGKTQILAARIGKILLDTDALPENILCLTYTDAGTIAMRKRLVEFIGPDAHKVNIHTFHSFCNDIIQDNLSLFERNSLDPISELETIQLLRDLVDSFPKVHPLKRFRGDVYYEIGNLKNLFSNMKREGWSPELINKAIDTYIEDLPCREEFIYKRKYREFNAGDLKKDAYEEECERMKKLRAAVNEFEHYQEMMRKRNRYDFDDMINWVIKAFETDPGLLSNYQERYQYILVDEYQDTSGTQNRLIHLLISYWDRPNVFVVGDDDQSIFRFQGANVENMVAFANAYTKDLLTVVLTNNYRSTQPILDVSKTLIDRNQERLVKQLEGLSKDLTASHNEISKLDHQPVIHEYETPKTEMADITTRIGNLIQNGVAPREIAVIYRENKYGLELSSYLRARNIPYYSKRSINILDDPFARKILTLMRYLNIEHEIPYSGDEMLFEIMHYDFYNIPPIETARLAVNLNEKKMAGETTSLRNLLFQKANSIPSDLFDKGPAKGMKELSAILERLIADVPNVTLQQLFGNVINQGGVLHHIMQHTDKIRLLQLTTALFDFVKAETHRDPSMQLKDLVSLLDLMQKEEITLPLIQVSGSENGVNLLTAHGSKGLEFDHVFVVGLNACNWEKKKAPNKGFKLPDTLFSSPSQTKNNEELRRLFYVALTRARKELFISYASFSNEGKETECSMFIDEIQEKHKLMVVRKNFEPGEFADFQLLMLKERPVQIEQNEEDYLDALLGRFEMNVTALNNYLKCPLSFYYKNLIRIPSGQNENLTFGSAMHYALENFFRIYSSDTTANPGKDEMLSFFKKYMLRHRENFTKEAYNRRMEQGEMVLGEYFDKYQGSWNRIMLLEHNIRNVVVNGVRIKGKLDKLEFAGKEVTVVDYKTGDPLKATKKLAAPTDKNPDGEDYWRQAVFYKLLVDNYPQKEWVVKNVEFDFIEPDKKKKFYRHRVEIGDADIETVKQQIMRVDEKVRQKDFYTGCGKEDCEWCSFARENGLVMNLPEVEEEE